jgi:thymidylate synthase (FAD)
VELLKGTKFPVLNDGFIQVIDWMGDDSDIAQAARTSYQKGTKSISDDRTLIRYLMRHHHTSPFEMVELKLFVRIPMDHWRQWIRHRTANVNEYSTRYSEAIDSMEKTKPDEWRLQSGTNKQGSSGLLEEWPEGYNDVNKMYTPGQYLCIMEKEFHDVSKFLYETRLKFNIAREQARKDLPLSNYTEAFWKCDIHNILHFLQLRMDLHAQLEIRSYANIIGNEIVAKLFPITWEAFVDYRLEAITLTRLEIEAIRDMNMPLNGIIFNKREHDEALEKFKKLGIIM